MLRDYANGAGDPHYDDLFIQTAVSLEERARCLAEEKPMTAVERVNLIC